jgi:hypothetical protein
MGVTDPFDVSLNLHQATQRHFSKYNKIHHYRRENLIQHTSFAFSLKNKTHLQ